MIRIRFAASALAALAAFGQQKEPELTKVVTICDVLLDESRYNGTKVAVLGRPLASDEGAWLTEDACETTPRAAERGFSISVWLENKNRTDTPKPTMAPLDQDSLDAKMKQAAKTTTLGQHQAFVCTGAVENGEIVPKGCGPANEDDRWEVVYGKVETGRGFGHLGGAPARIFVEAIIGIDKEGRPTRYHYLRPFEP